MGGDRITPQNGRTALKNKDSIDIVFNAELRDLAFLKKLCLCLCGGCSTFDKQRSYLYLRENSIESNCVIKPMCGFCRPMDLTKVQYFDRAPFKHFGMCAICGSDGFCVPTDQPKFEVNETGCLICCQLCCSDKEAVLMPYEYLRFPCCCCSNRVTKCSNFCGCCGPPTGNPLIYSNFFPEPLNAEPFVEASRAVTGLKPGEVQMK